MNMLDRMRGSAAALITITATLVSQRASADPLPNPTEQPSSQQDGLAVTVEGPEKIPYGGGEAIPPGYHVESQTRWGLAGTGIALGSVLWVTSLVAAISLDREKDQTLVDEQGGTRKDPAYGSRYSAMFIPVAGPFIAIPTAHASGTGAAILALDGALQVGSLAMAVAGFALPKKELVKNQTVVVTPMASATMMGLGLSGAL